MILIPEIGGIYTDLLIPIENLVIQIQHFLIEGISSKEPVPDYKSYEMIVDPYI